jgi:hypothetical protein
LPSLSSARFEAVWRLKCHIVEERRRKLFCYKYRLEAVPFCLKSANDRIKIFQEDNMSAQRAWLAIALIIMVLGLAWLLDELALFPQIHWLWTLGLVASGLLILILLGLDRVTWVLSGFFLIGAAFSLLRQLNYLPLRYEWPILLITFGLLMFLAVILPLKRPEWLLGAKDS